MKNENHLEKALANFTFGGIALAVAFLFKKWKDKYVNSFEYRNTDPDGALETIAFYHIALAIGVSMVFFAILHFGRFLRELKNERQKNNSGN